MPQDGRAAEVLNPRGSAPICLVCDHASAFLPPVLGTLGLAPGHRYAHAVWDVGAADLTADLSARLGAPAVLSRVSRLVHDCNRPPGAADAIPARSERIAVPGNRDLTEAERAERARQVYAPFHDLVDATLAGFAAPPALVTIHSFAPVWHGVPRAAELGLLHDADDRLATRMLPHAPPGIAAALNVPYSAADGVTHTLARHAIPRGLQNAMIEVRSDLVDSPDRVRRIGRILASMIDAALAELRVRA